MIENSNNSSSSIPASSASSTVEPNPPVVRGRPRSTSISSGSPNPAPGVPLPTLFPDVAPAPPQLSHYTNSNPFPFSFPSSSSSASASTSLASSLGPGWGSSTMSPNSGPGNGGGGGHKSSLSVPGILSPSPIVPGAVPRGGRHRRTQSVSPPGFPTMSENGENGFSTNGLAETRRSSEPSVPVSKAEGSAGIPVTSSPRQPRLNISTSIGTRLGHQRSPSSPTRSPRGKPLVPGSVSSLSTSPTHAPPFDQQQHASSHSLHHIHIPSSQHHPPISSHAALLQGVRSHALPHSPTLEASSSSSHHHDVSPLSTSPLMPHHGFAVRRLSGGQHNSTRPFISTSLSSSSTLSTPSSPGHSFSSPPFGPTSNGRVSPIPLDLSRSHPSDAARSDNLRHLALDQAMTDAVSDHYSTSPPTHQPARARRRSSNGSSYSPPLLPLPFDVPTPISPIGSTRPRSGSIGRSVSNSSSPASLYLDEDQGEAASPNAAPGGRSSPLENVRDEIDIARPPSPPLTSSESLFPNSGPLPAPSPPVSLSSLGFDIPSSIVPDLPRESTSPSPPPHSATPLSPTFSALSASRPPPSLSQTSLAPDNSETPDSLPPASPHHKPISLPLPLNAPTPLPPHLTGGSSARSRSRSRSREREKERNREKSSSSSRSRSRSGSREREEIMDGGERPRSPITGSSSGGGMRLTGLEFVPKVHSPLASPPATEPTQASKMSDGTEETEVEQREEEGEGEMSVDGERAEVEGGTQDEKRETYEPPTFPPPVPPTSNDQTLSSSLGLPRLAIPEASSPVGTPEHLEESPTSHNSYFALAPGAALARSPPPLPDHLATLPSLPLLERTSSWEDELEDDDFDNVEEDRNRAVGPSAGARRKSHGLTIETESVSILQALGIKKSPNELESHEDEGRRSNGEVEAHEQENQDDAQEEEGEREREYGALGFMDIDLEAQEAAEHHYEYDQGFGEAGDLSVGDLTNDSLTIDEESLSALERIFVCAKSEAVEERARVAHSLADWLPAVEICEAVEYVLPLLASLIEDEMVKEVFAPQLDRVMWHFFSHCPLAELDAEHDHEIASAGTAVPSRYKARSECDESRAPSVDGPSDRSATPPPTSETSPAQSHVDTSNSNLPRISATTFTALLGAMLTDQSTTVAKAAESAIVRFLCRLKDKPVPPASPPSTFASLDFGLPVMDAAPLPELAVSQPDSHSSYSFSSEARQVLEDEVVSGIVIGLARLDEEDPERSKMSDHAESNKGRVDDIKEDANENPVLFTSPEENSFDFSEDEPDLEMQMLMEWSQDRERKTLESLAVDVPSSSPPDQIFSSFSPEQPADEESSIGKMVSMSLIGAIAAADCLEPSVLVKQFLPEVERMRSESMFYVRKEAVQALGSLATSLPVVTLETALLPLHTYFSSDQLWHVRRAAVLALPAVCKRLPRPSLRQKAVEAIRQFSADDNRNVRSGALEIAGELIYLFHEDSDGVPEELLAFFLGKPLDSSDDNSTSGQEVSASSNPFSPFKSALDSPSSSFLDPPNLYHSPEFFGRNTQDADRSILTAFNFPAVILTLGRPRWGLVQEHHRQLCKDHVEKARQSLASSLHEVAKIIGPDQVDACLLEPLSAFLQDVDNVQSAAIENLPTLLLSFGPETAKKALVLLSEAWTDIHNWRLREHVLKKVAEFGPHFMQSDGEEEVLTVLAKAFKDSVARVREEAVVAVPPLLNSVLDRPTSRAKLFAFLAVFRGDSSYRNRVAYVSTIVACVRASLPRDSFELYFLDTLVDLARDKVVSVRIAVARAISEACQCPALYSDPSTRGALREILSILSESSDRDVRLPILEYCNSPSPTQSPPPRTDASQNNTVDAPPPPSSQADDEEDSTTGDDGDEDGERNDVDMGESSGPHFETDGVLLSHPSPSSGDVHTRDEGDFVEVSRHSY